MKLTTVATSAVLFASSVFAAPLVAKRQAITDVDILQFALTLEHLENVFYKGAISAFPEQMFLDAGFSSEFFNNLKFIVTDEEEHVRLLTEAIAATGASPVAACEYNFPYTDIASFVSLASVLEGVGVSAYLGASPFVADKAILSVAASILVTEAIHVSLQRTSLHQVAAANPYGTGLGINAVFTLAATFIKSCPSTNAALPVMAFPALTATQHGPASAGITFTFSVSGHLPEVFFVTFVSGIFTTSVPGKMMNGMIEATIPDTAMGQTYAFITSENVSTTIMDSMVLFGPAIIEVTPPSPTFDLTIQ
ncbi:hypothetical protein MMC24_002007 [Lignoscripta atroalba]|nr:hypothetical protein [Lignoscripta atroalba]